MSADNTTVAGGDVISTEDLPVGAQRGSADVPTTEYKLPRSKIAVGRYGADDGDVSTVNALAVQMLHERRLLEDGLVQATNDGRTAMRTRNNERMDLLDRRGGNGHRGVR